MRKPYIYVGRKLGFFHEKVVDRYCPLEWDKHIWRTFAKKIRNRILRLSKNKKNLKGDKEIN